MFADNDRISGIQISRQFKLAYLAPVLLWFYRGTSIRNSIVGIFLGSILLLLWMFFLVRLSYGICHMEKWTGKTLNFLIQLFFYSYLLFLGGFLLVKTGRIISLHMVPGLFPRFASFLFLIVSLAGCRNIQARGRFAQTIWPLAGGITFLLLVLAVLFGETGTQEEILMSQSWDKNAWKEAADQGIWMLAIFSGIIFIPMLDGHITDVGKTSRQMFHTVGKTGMALTGILLLYVVTLGEKGAAFFDCPILQVMGGIRLPGGFLRRLDLVFLSVLMFCLLFSMGSILFYGQVILDKYKIKNGRIWTAGLCFAASLISTKSWKLEEEFPQMMVYIYLPLFLGITVCLNFMKKQKKTVLPVLCLSLLLSGCSMIEPEKRAYPLVAGIEQEGEEYKVYLAMARLASSTGQEKSGGEAQPGADHNVIVIKGKDKEETLAYYNKRYQLFLDPGHVQAVILDSKMQQDTVEKIIREMEIETAMGTGASVFQTEQMQKVFSFHGENDVSLGKYLAGIYENRVEGKMPLTVAKAGCRIRQEDKNWKIPVISVEENSLCVDKE